MKRPEKLSLLRPSCVGRYLVALCMCFGFLVSYGAGSVFELKGIISATNRIANPSSSFACFTVSVSNCSWRIDFDKFTDFVVVSGPAAQTRLRKRNGVVELPAGSRVATVRDRVSSGTWEMEVRSVQERSGGSITNDAVSGAVQIDSMPLEYGPFPFKQVLWVAFASGCFFDLEGTNVFDMYSPVAIGFDRRKDRFAGEFLNASSPKLPKSFEFTDSGTVFVNGIVYPRPFPYSKGFVSVKYEVVEYFTTNNMLLPTKFELRVFRPESQKSDSGDIEIEEEFFCQVTNISTSLIGKVFSPELPANKTAIISDSRASIQPFQYTGQSWLPIQEVTNSKQFKAWAVKHPGSRISIQPIGRIENPQRSPIVRMILVFLVALIPFVIVLGRKKSSRSA